MTDLISRADAIEAVAQQWLFEASVGNPYVNDDDIGEYRKLAEELFEDVPSADAVSRETYHNLVTASNDIDRALREYHAKEENGELVSVVRCKDCIHWKADNEVFELGFCCVFPQKWVAETFYCADGERRE